MVQPNSNLLRFLGKYEYNFNTISKYSLYFSEYFTWINSFYPNNSLT